MPDFSEYFNESHGQPILYNGQQLVMSDYFPVGSTTCFRLTIEVCNGQAVQDDPASDWPSWVSFHGLDGSNPHCSIPPGGWRQAACIKLVWLDKEGRWRLGASKRNPGAINLVGSTESYSGKQGISFRQSPWQNSVEFQINGNPDALEVRNAWDAGDGTQQSWTYGSAIIVEGIENGRRYHCNDGEPDDDFNDIIFRLESLQYRSDAGG